MKKKPELLTKCLSGLASLTLIASSVLSVPVMAEENLDDIGQTEFLEESGDTESIEEPLAVYIITDFRDFHKTEEGKFEKEEIQNKYGEFSVLPGTSLEQLDLPDKIVLDGYWQADGVAETLELSDVDWKLKSDIGEVYSEASPEGNYTFVPDLDAYLLTSESIDEFVMADDSVKLPEISLTVTALPETETQNSGDTLEDGNVPVPETSAEADPAADVSLDVEPADVPVDEEENIFDGLDNSILDGSDSGDVVIYDGTDGNSADADIPTDAAVIDDSADINPEESMEAADTTPTESTETADTTPTESAEAADVTPVNEPAPEAAKAEVLLSIADINGNILYNYTDTNGVISLTADTAGVDNTFTIPAISGLYCGADLSTLKISFNGTGVSAGKTYVLTELLNGTETAADTWNFADGGEKTFRLTEYMDGVPTSNTYTVKFAGIAQNAHTVGNNASCTANATCTVCGAAIPNTMTAHQFSPATCTESEKCINCGAVGAAAKGHTWIEATCTTAKTCSVCGAVEGAALGHDWEAATCTTPKTCNRCGATEGKALGHDMNDDWDTVEASTDTTHGKQIRYCSRDCGYYEERALNIIGNPNNNTILNLAEGGQYNLNTKITFSASGAAMGNTDPFDGDVRYVPLSWSIQGTPGTFMDGFTGAFSITKAGTYTVTVVFQKQIYENGSWKATDISDSKSVTFTVGNLVQGNLVGTADGIRINPQTGDSTPIIPLAVALVAALAVIIGVVIFKKKK